MCLNSLQVCKAPRPRPELHCGDTKVVLRATRGLLDLFMRRGASQTLRQGLGRHVDALNPPLLPRKDQVALCSRLQVCVVSCASVCAAFCWRNKRAMLVVPGGRPLSGRFGENTGTSAVKTVWRANGNGHPAARGSLWGDTYKGAEGPRYCPCEGTERFRPHAG